MSRGRGGGLAWSGDLQHTSTPSGGYVDLDVDDVDTKQTTLFTVDVTPKTNISFCNVAPRFGNIRSLRSFCRCQLWISGSSIGWREM